MSFVPSKRLLWFVALVIVPAWFVLGMAGAPVEVLVLAGVVIVGMLALDALTSLQRLNGIQVILPETVRTSKSKSFKLEAIVQDASGSTRQLRVGLPFPRWLEVESPELNVTMPADGSGAKPQWSVLALERGAFTLTRCHVEGPSRLGLWDMRRTVECQCEVRVYPDLSRERHLLAPLFFRRGTIGTHQVRQLGKGREFEQLRAYTAGDSYGDIYWKGTAKRRFPVTMMYQIERTQEMHVILDISRRSARPLENIGPVEDRLAPKTQLERFIQAALVLALAAEQQNDRFGMMTFSDQVHTTLPAGGGRSHYNACRDALYTLEPRIVSPDFGELFITVGNRLRHRSLVIVLTDLGEPWLSESFSEAVRQAARRHVVLVHTLGSKEFQPLFNRNDSIAHTDDLYSRLAGHLMWSDLQETSRDLKQCGVHLTSSLQENLIADVVSEYLNVKKRQLL
jgi:uncharacterized protein (DUF58 family)